MKIKTTLVSIIITVIVIAAVAYISISHKNEQNLSYTNSVIITDGKIEDTRLNPVYFNPVGDTCSFKIDIAGPDEFISNIRITTVMPNNDPVYSASATNVTLTTGELNVANNGIFLMITPELKGGAVLEDGEYSVSYKVLLHAEDLSTFDNGITIAIAVALLAFGIFIIFSVNRSYEKEYDERQIRVRGMAAMNSFLVVIVCLFAVGLYSFTSEGFPLTLYECAMGLALIGTATFTIISDMNDAYMGIRGKRYPLAIIFLIVGILELLMSGVFGFLFGSIGSFNLGFIYLITGICLTTMGIEMIIKGAAEKRELRAEEAEDEKLKT